MIDFHKELLITAIRDIGLEEIKGPKDHPKILLAHRITGMNDSLADDSRDIDAIPWCSSMMNLWVLQTGMRINPGRVIGWMKKREFPDTIIAAVGSYEGLLKTPNWLSISDNGINIPQPTWTAWALDWASICSPVSPDAWRIGDWAVFSRDGGGHIALLLRRGWVFVNVLGGNQHDMVCEADTYLRAKLVAIRRFNG